MSQKKQARLKDAKARVASLRKERAAPARAKAKAGVVTRATSGSRVASARRRGSICPTLGLLSFRSN